jgi:SAM-dependent methyltransferase
VPPVKLRAIAGVALAYTGLLEGAAAVVRLRERTAAFDAASERATALGRRLVVIGDPDAGASTRIIRAAGCGDVCVDMNGCPRCPVTIVADITAGPIPGIADDSAVVFVSCVLEYVHDLNAALAEIARIAGSAENLFVVNVQPWTLTARLYPGARWRGSVVAQGGSQVVNMKAIETEEKILAAGALGLALAFVFWPRGRR